MVPFLGLYFYGNNFFTILDHFKIISDIDSI